MLSMGSKHLRWLSPLGSPSRCRRPIPVVPRMRRCSLASRRGKFPGKWPTSCRTQDSDIHAKAGAIPEYCRSLLLIRPDQ